MKLSPKQAQALDAIAAWLVDPSAKQTFYLAGHAGSGKTTCAKHAVEGAKGRAIFCAPTAKAALVMRRKGCPDAKTIHSVAYRLAGDGLTSLDEIEALKAELALREKAGDQVGIVRVRELIRRAIEDRARQNGPRFSLNVNSDIRNASVVVVDEASMVNESMGRDLESFGIKILAIGDPAQLPPVYGVGYFTSRDPDAYLDEIHRQALDSPILRLADLARRGQPLPIGRIDENVDVCTFRPGRSDPTLEKRVLEAQMVLVGRNRTRHACNHKIRRLIGHGDEPAPVAGDRVVCLRNDHERGIMNGSTWVVDRCLPNLERMTAKIEVHSTDDDSRIECDAWLHHFMAREQELDGLPRRDRTELGYGWCLTVHKSQGGQADDVFVFDESRQFGKDAAKHLYTAITRSSKVLTVAVPA